MGLRVAFALWALLTALVAYLFERLFDGGRLSFPLALLVTVGIPALLLRQPMGEDGLYDEGLVLLEQVLGWLKANARAATAVAEMTTRAGTGAANLGFQIRNHRIAEAASSGATVELDAPDLMHVQTLLARCARDAGDAFLYLDALDVLAVAFYVSEPCYGRHLEKYRRFVALLSPVVSRHPTLLRPAVRATLGSIAQDLRDVGHLTVALPLERALRARPRAA